MKKIWTIGMMLLLMSSCVKHADIYLKLSEEDAAAIPYREGQTVKFLDQNGDTVTYEVTRDEINKFVERRKIEVYDNYMIVLNINDMKRTVDTRGGARSAGL